MTAVALLISAGLFALGVIVMKAGSMKRLRDDLVAYDLQFAPGLKTEAVFGFLGGLTGLLLPWWRRWLVTPFVILEVRAHAAGIDHTLLVPRDWSVLVENLLQAHAASVRYTPNELPEPISAVAAEYRLSTARRVLRVDPVNLSARLLTGLQPLRPHEEVVVQWVMTAAGPVIPAHTATAADRRCSLCWAAAPS